MAYNMRDSCHALCFPYCYHFKSAECPETISVSEYKFCVLQLQGEITVCNIYVSSYRPPCDVSVYPSPPNRIVLSVQDLDIGYEF